MNTNNYPLVSFITLNYNNTSVTADLLRSMRKLTYPNIEVIVVDNHSDIDPAPELMAVYPDVKIIYNSKNLGFTGGNNAGIHSARGEYLFFINNDTEVNPNLVEPLLDVFENYPDAGAVSPKIYYFFHPGIIQYAGYKKINSFTGRTGAIGSKKVDNGQYDFIKPTYYAHGAAMMIPRKVMEQVGEWPDIYFIYYEELDLSLAIRRKGYKIYFQPRSILYHKESMTVGKSSPFKTYYMNRNRILFMRRNVSFFSLIFFYSYLLFFTIPKNSATFILKKQRDHLLAFWKAIIWHMRHPILD
ncbi:MAG: glycosyltransferase family 2 protein [Thermoflavifilum sp.]|uniref:glycosyltransferase family 2 protein n=1 Tax=Thermoflavifilum sp. TaxID=1968839 RepID=UPI0018A50809|nr:glycosyltransferase family 2 protein [Thermoflavifilum sp.]QOR76436.1 MAG: glycosyltransferase family 2 protein [Thermoflavifilum sp.]